VLRHFGSPQQFGTAEDITERKRSESEREQLLAGSRQHAAAGQPTGLKMTFLSMVSHELRNPSVQ